MLGTFRPYNRRHVSLISGTRLGVYEITVWIGEGGMGQVYRASDTTLGRRSGGNMRNVLSGSRVVTALCLAIVTTTARAQNIDEMARWTSAEIVHYDVVAEYTGTTPVLVPIKGTPVTSYPTQVKDRYEIGFDWSPTEMTMVGKPAFRNFPSTLPVGTPARLLFNAQTCPQPRMTGSYDHVEVIGAKTGMMGSNSLELSVKRTYPAGAIPYATEVPGCSNWGPTCRRRSIP